MGLAIVIDDLCRMKEATDSSFDAGCLAGAIDAIEETTNLLSHAREFWFAAVPEDHYLRAFSDIDMYGATVAYRDVDSWAVLDGYGRRSYGRDGEWDFEPSPSNRTDEWKVNHRWTLDEAVEVATEVVVPQILARLERQHPEEAVRARFAGEDQ